VPLNIHLDADGLVQVHKVSKIHVGENAGLAAIVRNLRTCERCAWDVPQ
jgi:hypothetical protein